MKEMQKNTALHLWKHHLKRRIREYRTRRAQYLKEFLNGSNEAS